MQSIKVWTQTLPPNRTLNRYLWPRQSTYHWCLVWLAHSTKSFILALTTYPEIWLLRVDTEVNTFPTCLHCVNTTFFLLPSVDVHLLHRKPSLLLVEKTCQRYGEEKDKRKVLVLISSLWVSDG